MNKIIYLLIVTGLIILTSCNRKTTIQERISYKDTTIVRVSFQDTTIYFPEETAEIDGIKVSIDTSGKSQLKPITKTSGRATVKVQIKDNILSASANCDSLEAVVKLKNTEIEHLKETIVEKTKEQNVQKVKKVSSFTQFTKWWFFITIILIIIVLTIKYK